MQSNESIMSVVGLNATAALGVVECQSNYNADKSTAKINIQL